MITLIEQNIVAIAAMDFVAPPASRNLIVTTAAEDQVAIVVPTPRVDIPCGAAEILYFIESHDVLHCCASRMIAIGLRSMSQGRAGEAVTLGTGGLRAFEPGSASVR